MKPTVIDLFAGVGGFSLGFEQAGFDIVLANEYDKSIAHAYSENRPGIPMIVEDITRLSIGETFDRFRGKTTVIIGGPPCQGFSQKGKRKSVNDPRNFLFRYYFEVVDRVRPLSDADVVLFARQTSGFRRTDVAPASSDGMAIPPWSSRVPREPAQRSGTRSAT